MTTEQTLRQVALVVGCALLGLGLPQCREEKPERLGRVEEIASKLLSEPNNLARDRVEKSLHGTKAVVRGSVFWLPHNEMVRRWKNGKPYIVVRPDPAIDEVFGCVCTFSDKYEDALARLAPHQAVAAEGRFAYLSSETDIISFANFLFFYDCKLLAE